MDCGFVSLRSAVIASFVTSESFVLRYGRLMSTLLSWLIAGIKLLVLILVITWTTLAIYFSNLPWPALRLGLAVSFAAFAILAFWLSGLRGRPACACSLMF